MKERHIDELFQGENLNTKIIFEQRVTEYQSENVSLHLLKDINICIILLIDFLF